METFTYKTAVTYSCPLLGWGYPSNGFSSVVNYCQSDKKWNLTTVENWQAFE